MVLPPQCTGGLDGQSDMNRVGAVVEAAQDVESGDNECATVSEDWTLKVWRQRDSDNIPCRISVKDVGSCPPPK